MAINSWIRSKKGVLFTLAAFLMVAAIALTGPYIGSRYSEQASVNVVRLVSLHNFIRNAQDDLDVAVYTTSFRSLVAIQEYVSTHGIYIDDTNARINELVINGTLYGFQNSLMTNNTIGKWVNDIEIRAENIGLDFDLAISDILVSQENPWNITVEVTYVFILNDSKGVASFTDSGIRRTQIPIIDFLDPVSIVESSGRVVATINKTPFEGNFEPHITEHIEGNFFAAWAGAPSYMQRLEGDLSPSPHGIERLIDKIALSNEGFVIIQEATSADHDYWSSAQNGFTFDVGPQYFRLDNITVNGTSHIARYNLSHRVS